MATFTSFDSAKIWYEVTGSGPTVVMLHSFGFNGTLWDKLGISDQVVAAGLTAVRMDARAHGRSASPHDPDAYAGDAMALDVVALLDELDLARASVLAYSMGAQTALRVLQIEPRIEAAVLGGIGNSALDPGEPEDEEAIAAFESAEIDTLPLGVKTFRERLARWGTDHKAIAALLRATPMTIDPNFSNVTAAVRIITGERDDGAGDPEALAALIPHAEAFRVAADHATTMDHPDFASAAVSFLKQNIRSWP